MVEPPQSVYLIKGDDSSLISEALSSLVEQLLGDRAPDLALQDIPEDSDLATVLDACQTPAFLSDRRVVVVRSAGRFRADQVEPLITYLSSPMPTTSLILVAGGGAIATRLQKAIKEHGHVIDASSPSGKARQAWLTQRLKQSPVNLDRRAVQLLQERLGDELGQLGGILDAMASAYGEGADVDCEALEPFLGAGGTAAPWELTDAIDGGDTSTALTQLRRMLEGGQRHPLVVMATLIRHYASLLRLDGARVDSESKAATLLGIGPYPAKKAMNQMRKMGTKNIGRAIELLAQADIDLRGASSWPGPMTMEILVARLCRLAPSWRPPARAARNA
jgi:DNA polymerase III subunit delta